MSSYPDGSFREFTRWGSADFRRPPEQLQKDLHDNKTSGVNGLGTGQRCEREFCRSLSSWGSGFNHSSSSKSLGGIDSGEWKPELQQKTLIPIQSHSGDAAACVLSAAPSGETTPRKKPCLEWGQGLAKYEKKKVECPDKSMNRVEATTSAGSTESSNSMSSNLADKSSRVLGFSDCSSPATPSSVDFGSSPAANIDNDISNLCSSPSLRSQNHPGGSAFSFEKLDTNSVIYWGSSLIDLLQSDEPTTSSSLPDEENGKTCEEQKIVSVMVHQPTSLKIDNCGNVLREKLPLCNGVLQEVNADVKDGPLSLEKLVSASDNLVTSQLTTMEEVVLVTASSNEGSGTPISGEASMVKKIDDNAHVPGSLNYDAGRENIVYVEILTPYKELANGACKVFNNLLPKDQYRIKISDIHNAASCQTDSSIRKRIAMQKQYLRFKERILSLKFKAFHHAWNEDMCLLSVRKCHAKSQKKYKFSLCSTDGGYQKHCSSILSQLSSVMINIASKLLLDFNGRLYRNALKMPALVLDEKEKQVSRFISSNGLVEDPCAAEKERALINPSTSEEKEIFIDKLAAFGKDFRKIASFLDHKTTADCVEFYYKNLKYECFERKKKLDLSKQGKSFMKLLTSRKKWSREFNAASLDVLGAASVITAHAENAMQNQKTSSCRIFFESHCNSRTSQFDDSIAKRSSSSDIIWKDEVAVAADVLADTSSRSICRLDANKAKDECIDRNSSSGFSFSSKDPQQGPPDLNSTSESSGTLVQKEQFSAKNSAFCDSDAFQCEKTCNQDRLSSTLDYEKNENKRDASLPDSAMLLAKYPAAFVNYPASLSQVHPQALQPLVQSTERNFNGVPVYSLREISSTGVDYLVYRGHHCMKVAQFTIDMKQQHEMFPQMGMVGTIVVGRVGLLSDSVAVLRMQYSKTKKPNDGQNESIIREEDSWNR
ncbi:hypothetical protein ES332_A05G326800v1 [Gossypium tomentosum]|uniref:SANT domain-containing protein n=1 Tax=Gossypium tomentosum TaxID=34277 RepID=A0A5D2QQM1_GOSTO|nr:hypothetical protein ES332_A05G326800v1 [Gossypium tomentosum]